MSSLKKLKSLIIEVAGAAREGHIPSALSILDILFVTYNEFLPFNDSSSSDNTGNRFILSKGHASIALYVVLHDLKKFVLY